MERNHTEEVRLDLGSTTVKAEWQFPTNSAPPFSTVCLFPPAAGFSRHGEEAGTPGHRPLARLSQALGEQGIATFRCEVIDAPWRNTVAAAWTRFRHHAAISKRRGVPFTWGPGGRALLDLWAEGHLRGPLSGMILATPEGPLATLPPFPLHVLVGQRPAELPMGSTAVPIADLTDDLRRDEDWVMGRPVTHPGLVQTVVDVARALLAPPWERAARPPGTVIGTRRETSSGP